MNINEILKDVKEDILTEEAKGVIVQIFNEQVEATVKEKLELAVKAALVEQDEIHTTKLEKLLEAIDEDHSSKLDMIVAKIDESHADKLKTIASKYEFMLKEDASEFKKDIVNKMSSYLDLKVKELVPLDMVQEACKNASARKMLDEIKKVLVIDSAYFNETIKEAVNEGKSTIDSLHADLKSALKENVSLQQQLLLIEAKSTLDDKTKGLTKEKADYARRILKEKDSEYIKENFDYVLKLYEESLSDNMNAEATSSSKKTKVIKESIDIPKKADRLSDTQVKGVVEDYLETLRSLDGIDK